MADCRALIGKRFDLGFQKAPGGRRQAGKDKVASFLNREVIVLEQAVVKDVFHQTVLAVMENITRNQGAVIVFVKRKIAYIMQYGRVGVLVNERDLCRYAVQIQHGKTVRMDKGHGKGQLLANWAFGLRFHKIVKHHPGERCLRFFPLCGHAAPGLVGPVALVIALDTLVFHMIVADYRALAVCGGCAPYGPVHGVCFRYGAGQKIKLVRDYDLHAATSDVSCGRPSVSHLSSLSFIF